jgi:hypothetical protein
MKIIVLLGLPLSGKTTHAKGVMDEMNIPLVETGTFVYREVEERGLDATPENVLMVVGELKNEADHYLTEKAYNYAKENYADAPAVFFSGMKAQSEVDLTRHARLLNVDRKAESKGGKAQEDVAMASDINRFNLRDKKELDYGLGKLMALANFVVNVEDKTWPYKKFDQTIEDFKIILSEIIKK